MRKAGASINVAVAFMTRECIGGRVQTEDEESSRALASVRSNGRIKGSHLAWD